MTRSLPSAREAEQGGKDWGGRKGFTLWHLTGSALSVEEVGGRIYKEEKSGSSRGSVVTSRSEFEIIRKPEEKKLKESAKGKPVGRKKELHQGGGKKGTSS